MNTNVLDLSIWLDYVEHGNRYGLPVLFLHGYTDSRRSFDRLIPFLPESVHAIVVSLRGHGDSARPEHGYTPDHFAADVAALMDRMGFERAIIVGHSMGATVAQRFALSYPQRAVALILIGSFFSLRGSPNAQEFWETTISRLDDPVDPEIVRNFQLSTIAKPLPETFIDTVVRESLKLPAEVWKAVFKDLAATDFTNELGNIRRPVLLLWGDRDAFVSRGDQDRLQGAIPFSILSVYRGVGHSPHWEAPQQTAKEIATFISQFGG